MAEKLKRFFLPSPLDGHFQALGRVAVLWASLEHEINSAIWHLSNVESTNGACVTSQLLNPLARLRAFMALVRQRGGDGNLVNSINALISEVDALSQRRNRLIHDPWIDSSTGPDIGYRLEITANRKLHYEWKPETIETINQTALDIHDVRAEFLALYKRTIDELPAFPQDRFNQSFEIPGLILE